MALIKIYAKRENYQEAIDHLARTVKLVGAAALNVPEVPTSPSSIETVFGEGIDLIGIDYIFEIIAVERANQQHIAERFIAGMNAVYPEKLFSMYFNNITENGMANTPREAVKEQLISMDEAIERSRDEI